MSDGPHTADLHATVARFMSATIRYQPTVRFVHPTVYAKRASCPLWTNVPNALHEHDRDCRSMSGVSR